MTLNDAIKSAWASLETKSTSPELDAEVLLSFVLKQSKEYLALNPKEEMSIADLTQFNDLVIKRSEGWPVAYLTGRQGFFGLDFEVNPHVLIPRPATEEMVAEIIKRTSGQSNLKILDVGTGSGCIIISLAKILGSANQYFASDISQDSLEVARRNATHHGVSITFTQSDLLSAWHGENFDVIIANLPYGWKGWTNKSSMDSVGLKYEPPHALFTGNDGLELIEKLLQQISSLTPARTTDVVQSGGPHPSYLFLEFDPRQEVKLKTLAQELLPEFRYEMFKDLAGHPRYACLSRAQ